MSTHIQGECQNFIYRTPDEAFQLRLTTRSNLFLLQYRCGCWTARLCLISIYWWESLVQSFVNKLPRGAHWNCQILYKDAFKNSLFVDRRAIILKKVLFVSAFRIKFWSRAARVSILYGQAAGGVAFYRWCGAIPLSSCCSTNCLGHQIGEDLD